VHLAADPLEDEAAVYWKDSRPLAPDPYALREDEARRLWELSDRLCGM